MCGHAPARVPASRPGSQPSPTNATPVVPPAAKDREPKRPSRPVSPEPERDAA
jgi:hypothetical protein